jgi:hypothetical protein
MSRTIQTVGLLWQEWTEGFPGAGSLLSNN